jgi:hypothetical protein
MPVEKSEKKLKQKGGGWFLKKDNKWFGWEE